MYHLTGNQAFFFLLWLHILFLSPFASFRSHKGFLSVYFSRTLSTRRSVLGSMGGGWFSKTVHNYHQRLLSRPLYKSFPSWKKKHLGKPLTERNVAAQGSVLVTLRPLQKGRTKIESRKKRENYHTLVSASVSYLQIVSSERVHS